MDGRFTLRTYIIYHRAYSNTLPHLLTPSLPHSLTPSLPFLYPSYIRICSVIYDSGQVSLEHLLHSRNSNPLSQPTLSLSPRRLHRAVVHPLPPALKGGQIALLKSLICTGARRNPTACGANQGNYTRRPAPSRTTPESKRGSPKVNFPLTTKVFKSGDRLLRRFE